METYRSTYAIDISNGNEKIKFPVRKFRGTFEDVLMRSAARAEVKADDEIVTSKSTKGTDIPEFPIKWSRRAERRKANFSHRDERAKKIASKGRCDYLCNRHKLWVDPLTIQERRRISKTKYSFADYEEEMEYRKEEEMRLAYEKRQDAFDRFAELEDKILKLEEQKRHLEQVICDLRYEQSQITF